MPTPDDHVTEPESSEAEFAATISALQPTLSHTSISGPVLTSASPSSLTHNRLPSLPSDAFVRRRPRLHTALRLSATSASTYSTSAPNTATTCHYTLTPPTLALSASTLASPALPNHLTTHHATFTFHHLFPPLDPARTVHRQLLRPLLDGCVEGSAGNVVVVCYGEDGRAKTELLLGREAGAGVIVQAMGTLLQAIKQREKDETAGEKQTVKVEEEKREAEDDEQHQQQQPTAASPHAVNPQQRRRKHRLTLSALRLTHSTLTDLLSPATQVSLAALSTSVSTVDVNGWTEHRIKAPQDCVRLLLQADKHTVHAETADGDGHVLYRVGVQSRWRRGVGEEAGGGSTSGDGYRYSSLTFVKLAAHGSSASVVSPPSSASSSAAAPFSPHWVNKDILALTRVLSCLLTPNAAPTSPSSIPLSSFSHIPYRSSLLTCSLSSALEQCSELVLLFGLRERTDGGESSGWDEGREEWRFVEELGGVVVGKRQKDEESRQRRKWRGQGAEEEQDSDDEGNTQVPTVLEYYKAECAKRSAALNPLSTSPPSPQPASPLPQPVVTQPQPQPPRPATPPPTEPQSTTPAPEQKQHKPPDNPSTDTAADEVEAKRKKDEEAAAALKRRAEKEAENRAAILLARQQQQQRDLDRELRTLQPLLTALSLPARRVSTAAQLAELKAEVDRAVRQRVCGGVSVWKWSKKRVGGEVKRRECEVRWDDELGGVVWEGRKRWRQVVKVVRREEVERLVVGGGLAGGVLEEWKARMRALGEKQKADSGSEWSKAEQSEMKRQLRAIDRWSISVVSGGRVLDVVCGSEECHVVLLEGLKRLLGDTVKVEDRRPGNGGMKVRDVKV